MQQSHKIRNNVRSGFFLRHIAACLCGIVVLSLPGALPASSQDTAPAPSQWREETIGPRPDWSWLVVLRFVTETDYPPFNYRDEDGTLTGFNVDLARAICRELNVTCDINTLDWARLLPSLKDDEADAVIASLAVTPQTVSQVDFTDSYYVTPAKFVFRNSSPLQSVNPEDLEDVKIGVVKNTAHETYLKHFFSESEIVPLTRTRQPGQRSKKKRSSCFSAMPSA